MYYSAFYHVIINLHCGIPLYIELCFNLVFFASESISEIVLQSSSTIEELLVEFPLVLSVY